MPLEINESDIFIGNKIRLYRKKMGWGLKLLASKLNISIQQLQKYESSTNKVSASLLYKISKIFEIPIGHFFEAMPEEDDIQNRPKSGFNVLVIEDDLEDEFVIREAISDFPEKVNMYAIREGYKALDFLKELTKNSLSAFVKPDIILLELHLPKMSGIEILKNIKRDKSINYIPVIALTSSTSTEDTLSSYNLQASGLIIKSCSTEEFKAQIHHVLSYWTQLVKLPNTA